MTVGERTWWRFSKYRSESISVVSFVGRRITLDVNMDMYMKCA